jgi:hypothetical protein
MDLQTVVVALTGAGVMNVVGGILVAAVSKAVKKEKLLTAVKPSAAVVGKGFSTLTRKRFGQKLSDEIEQGIVATVFYVARGWLDECERVMYSDNAQVPNAK